MRLNKERVLTPILISLLLLLADSSYGGKLREHFEKTYDLKAGGRIILSNTNGRIEIRSWDREQVKIEAEKEVEAGSRRAAEEFMREVRIRIDRREGEILIETDYPRRRHGGNFLDFIFGRRPHVKVDYRLLVPQQVDLDIRSVNGGVEIAEVKGTVRARTTNGAIELSGIRGSVSAKTTNGHIKAELLKLVENEDMEFKTTNGGITVYLPRDVEADINASTTNGSIRTDFPLEIRGRFVGKRLRGKINGGGGLIELHTTNGGIKILEL